MYSNCRASPIIVWWCNWHSASGSFPVYTGTGTYAGTGTLE